MYRVVHTAQEGAQQLVGIRIREAMALCEVPCDTVRTGNQTLCCSSKIIMGKKSKSRLHTLL